MSVDRNTPSIALPKGGGAISDLGEKFAADLSTGSGSLSVPLPVPEGRSGATPRLSLGYATGQGNGLFGLGWALGTPGVARKTSKGIPRYQDDRDVFLLSGSEDLVPVEGAGTGRTRYRPRTENLFARIEHVRGDGSDYWEVRSTDGSLTRYGTPRPPDAPAGWRDPAVDADPGNPAHIFAWQVTETRDAMGNLVRYEYTRDSGDEPGHRWDRPLLTRISYGDYGDRRAPAFLIRVDFAYEERPDRYSDRRAGFELRTTVRCRTVRVSTHAADGIERVSKEYRMRYRQAAFSGASLLTAIQPVGMDGDAEEPLPPLSFTYTGFDPAGRRFERVGGPGLRAVPLDSPEVALVDLQGTGLPDIVELGAVKRVWRNIGGGRFAVPRLLDEVPPYSLGEAGVSLMDADGDGRSDLVVTGANAGYFPSTFAGGWSRRSFQPYRQTPSVPTGDANVKLADLDGDGLTDVLRSGTALEVWFNDRDTRSAWRRYAVSTGTGPLVDLADPRVRLADMTGDGLPDIVLLTNGGVTYRPNLGHNRWGAEVTMRHSPRLASTEDGGGYDPRRVLLADVDGDGAADLVYVGTGRILVWGNQSGDGWTEHPLVVPGTPDVANTDTIQASDLYGTGMAGLLFGRANDRGGRPTLRFLDLTGGVKPHLMDGFDNHLGATTRITYTTSTAEYLRDAADPATRWRTPLPMPVHVVSRVEVTDAISGGRLTTRYRYRHGYWDGFEREFRGFARVEQLDSEEFPGDGDGPAEHFSPPTLTKYWHHTGPVSTADARDWTELDLHDEYWPGDGTMAARPADQRAFLAGLTRSGRRDALRTLRGHRLRTEVYALDGTALQDRPYEVTETVVGVRPEVDERVFFPFSIATRSTRWERGSEPQTHFTFGIGFDAYGNPIGRLTVAVPRGRDPMVTAAPGGTGYLAALSKTEYANRDDESHYLIGRLVRTSSYEVVNDGRTTISGLLDAVLAAAAGSVLTDAPGSLAGDAPALAPPPVTGPVVTLRLTGHARTFYDGDAFAGMPFGALGEHGLPTREESLAFTDDFLTGLFDPTDPLAVTPAPAYLGTGGQMAWPAEYPAEFRALLPTLAGYAHYAEGEIPGSPAGYYMVTARHRYDVTVADRVPRGLLVASMDPLGAVSAVEYDRHDLLPVRTVDPAGLATEALNDYRVLHPHTVIDANGNSTTVTFSPGGLVTEMFVRGADGEGDGTEPSTSIDYDLLAFAQRGAPASVRTTRRVYHDTDTTVPVAQRSAVIVSVAYSDGFDRLVQTRSQAEDTLFGDPAFGGGVLGSDTTVPVGDAAGHTRADGSPDNVVVSGWQVYDNKGRVVWQYEPFFATGYDWSRPADAQNGRRTAHFYDPRGQMVRTVNPDGSEQRVVPGIPVDLTDPERFVPTPWESYTYDANDNAGRTHPAAGDAYRSHWNTPASIEVDALGRTVRAVARNGPAAADWFTTLTSYDVNGNPLTVTDPRGRTAFRYTYDLAGRRWRVDGMDGGRRDRVLDAIGNPVENRDAKGAFGVIAYDVLHRPVRAWARDDASGLVTLRQRIEYGDAGTPDQAPADRAAARAANLLSRPVRRYDEAGLVTTEAIDAKGNLLRATRRVIADDPLLATYQAAPANGWQVPAFVVDWTPRAGQTQDQRDTELLEPAGYQSTTTYDALSRPVGHQLPVDVEGRHRQVDLTYNRAGGLAQMTLDGTVHVRDIAYDARGRRTLIVYGNGIMTRYAHDLLTSRLTRQRTESWTAPRPGLYRPRGPVLQDCGYEYDLVGNALAIHDRAPGSGLGASPDALDRAFTYDPVYRLLSATGREQAGRPGPDPWSDLPRGVDLTSAQPYRERYQYDEVGNLVRLAHAATGGFTRDFLVADDSNRLTGLRVGGNSYDHRMDANGNLLVEGGTRHFGWNHADRLATFATQTAGAEPSVHAHYLYDPSGQRVKKLVRRQGGAIQVTHYLSGLVEHHRWTASGGGANTLVHVMDDQQRVAVVRVGPAHPDDRGPAVAFHLADQLGSSTAVVDGSGVLTNREEYTPYGETSFGSFARKRYRFTGKERDEESGLAYHGSRYYAVWLGRWTATDPIGAAGGTNQFTYAAGNPAHLTDPNGHEPQPPRANGIGNVARYRDQPAAARDAGGALLTESEHGMPGAQLKNVNRNSLTGVSDYTDTHYRNNTTFRWERGSALHKTHGNRGGPGADNPRSAALAARVRNGGGISYKDDIFHPSLEQAQRSRVATGSAVTEAEINRAFLAQDGEMFAMQSLRDTGTKLAEFERAAGGPAPAVARTVAPVASKATWLSQGARAGGFALRKFGEASLLYSVGKHFFLAGTYLREQQWDAAANEGIELVKDLAPPVTALKPTTMTRPALGPGQSIFKARIEDMMRSSGCQTCHDAVRADYYFKSTASGQAWVTAHGLAAAGGLPTDAAWREFLRQGAPAGN